MSEKHSIMDSLKHAAVAAGLAEEVPDSSPAKSAPAPATPVANAPSLNFNTTYAPVPGTLTVSGTTGQLIPPTPIAPPDDGSAYQRLLAKTDFDQTEIAGTIHKFADPLTAVITDAGMRFKVAVTQAGAQAGITKDQILGVFDTLKNTLATEQTNFAAKAQQFESEHITARQNRLTEIQAQIQQLQAEMTQVATDLATDQGKAAQAQGAFTTALQRRSNEIDQQKAQYASLLQ